MPFLAVNLRRGNPHPVPVIARVSANYARGCLPGYFISGSVEVILNVC